MEIKIDGNKIYAPLKEKYLTLTPEEKVRQEYICRLVNDYGYSLEQMDQEVSISSSKRGQGRACADIVIWKNKEDKDNRNSCLVVVECKAEHITIHEDDYFQGYNYASLAGVDFFVTTNLKETRIFKVLKGQTPKKLDEIIDLPSAKDATNDKKIKTILAQTKSFTRDEFSKLLFKCHNIIRNNDKLSPEAAFDEISKILFIKIRFERDNTGTQIFSQDEFLKLKKTFKAISSKDSRPFYQQLFENIKEYFSKDDLFDPNDSLKIKEASFENIVKELQIYNLSITADDVKGIAFEKFLGKTFRGELGQFFTPRTVVDFMVEVLDPCENEVISDPCCGSGGFLIKAFEYVREKIELNIQTAKEKIKSELFDDTYLKASRKVQEKVEYQVEKYITLLNTELDTQKANSRLKSLSHDCIFGTDANPRMARTAKMNMIMHGDGHGGVHHHDGLLNVNGMFENRFDVILTNPPFGARVEKSLKITEEDKFTNIEKIAHYTENYGNKYLEALKQVNNNIGKSVLSLYESGKLSGLTEVLFIERCINLLKPGGRLGIVLPEGVLNNTQLQPVRELFEGKAKIILITSIPQDVFMASGATVKPSVMFFKKFTDEEQKQYKEIVNTIKLEITTKYETEIIEFKAIIADKETKIPERKVLQSKLKAIESKIELEMLQAKPIIKERFDYTIPIAQVEKAGINTTGGECDNELISLQKEYTIYRREQKLWNEIDYKCLYEIQDGKLMRKLKDKDWEELC